MVVGVEKYNKIPQSISSILYTHSCEDALSQYDIFYYHYGTIHIGIIILYTAEKK